MSRLSCPQPILIPKERKKEKKMAFIERPTEKVNRVDILSKIHSDKNKLVEKIDTTCIQRIFA